MHKIKKYLLLALAIIAIIIFLFYFGLFLTA